jgi:hypothetical protein
VDEAVTAPRRPIKTICGGCGATRIPKLPRPGGDDLWEWHECPPVPAPGEPELEMIEVPWSYCWLTLTANRRGTEEANAHYDVEHPCPGPHGTMWAARSNPKGPTLHELGG